MFESRLDERKAAATLAALTLAGCVSTREPDYDPAEIRGQSLAKIERIDEFHTYKQEHDRGCVPATLKALIDFINPGNTLTYDEIRAGLMDPRFARWNSGEYISLRTVEAYFNDVLSAKERGPYKIKFKVAEKFDEVVEALRETGRPVVIAYMLRVMEPGTANFMDDVVEVFPEGITKALTGGEEHVIPKYLHAG